MRIVILDGNTVNPGDLSWGALGEPGDLTVYDRTPDALIEERIAGAEIAFTNKTPLTRETISNAKSLRFIGVLATGYNTVDVRAARERGIPVRRLPKARLTQLAGPDHRGVAAEAASVEYAALADILAAAELAQQPPLILLLDGVEDPHNLGAIIRSAHCLGAHGVVIAKHRSAQLNQTVLRTSAGAAALLPVARVANLNQALQQLKDAGCWTVAVDMGGDDLWSGDLGGPLALVLGGEGSGISPLLKSNCDFCLSIPMSRGEIGSLNVSNAAAIVLAAAARQLRKSAWWQRQIAAGVCHYCGRKVGAAALTLDHVVPVARGGRSNKGNVVPACDACNKSKGVLTPAERILAELERDGAPLEEEW